MSDQTDLAALLPWCSPVGGVARPIVQRWCDTHHRTLDYCRDEASEIAARLHAAGVRVTGEAEPEPITDLTLVLHGTTSPGYEFAVTGDAVLDVERLALAVHRWHNPGSVTPCRDGSWCRHEATSIAREYAALATEEKP